jgi:hypothetical protein
MPQLNHQTTAEHIVGCVDATISFSRAISSLEVAGFLDIQERQAEAALEVATELRLLRKSGLNFEIDSPLCRFLATSSQNIKAAILRIVLESYEPFTNFRQRFQTTLDLSIAARQTKAQLSLGASRDEVKDTLVSLGTFSQALLPAGGGQYNILSSLLPDVFADIAGQAIDFDAAAQRIRVQLGGVASAAVDEASVITPLADALIRARNKDGRGAVLEAGNAVESYITNLATIAGVALGNATGLGSKLDKFAQPVMSLPKKLIAVGKYLSNVRNAADHGLDSEIGKMWEITDSTGLEFVFVACTFIRTTTAHVSSTDGII